MNRRRNCYAKWNQKLVIWKILNLLRLCKMRAYSEENTKGVAKQPFDKEISMGMKDKFNQPPWSRCQEQKWDYMSRGTARWN